MNTSKEGRAIKSECNENKTLLIAFPTCGGRRSRTSLNTGWRLTPTSPPSTRAGPRERLPPRSSRIIQKEILPPKSAKSHSLGSLSCPCSGFGRGCTYCAQLVRLFVHTSSIKIDQLSSVVTQDNYVIERRRLQ